MSAGTASTDVIGRRQPGPAEVRATARRAKPVTLAVGAVCVLGAVLRFYGIGHQGYWFDEGNTVLLIHYPVGKMLGLIPQSESTPPLYYCIAWVWARIFGFGEAGVRSLSAVAGTLVVPVAYGAGAKLVSRRVGLLTAALCACNPFLIWYSQEARAYELLVLLSALSLLAFAYVLEDASPRRMAAWAACCVLALATHYYAVVVIAPQAMWLLARLGRRRTVQLGVAAAALGGIALTPLVVSQNGTGRDDWIARSDLGVRLRQIVPQFLIGTGTPARTELKFAAMALAVGALGLLAVRARTGDGRRIALAGGLALAGFLLTLVLVAAGSDTLITRNIVGLLLPATIAVAGGLALARPRAVGLLIASALCAIGITATIGVAADYDLQRPDWRTVAAVLGARPATGTRVVLIQHYRTLLPLSLYLPGLRFMPSRGAGGVRELDVVAISSPQQPLCWWGAACNLIPSQLQARYDIPGFHTVWVDHVHRFTIMRLISAAPARVTPGEVAASLRTTALARDDLLAQR